jgi:hypothetical protein
MENIITYTDQTKKFGLEVKLLDFYSGGALSWIISYPNWCLP